MVYGVLLLTLSLLILSYLHPCSPMILLFLFDKYLTTNWSVSEVNIDNGGGRHIKQEGPLRSKLILYIYVLIIGTNFDSVGH